MFWFTPPAPTPPLHHPALAVRYLRRRFHVAEDTPQVSRTLSRLLTLLPAGARRLHDGNIVATCRACGIPSILTHNPGDFASFASTITIEPLVGAITK